MLVLIQRKESGWQSICVTAMVDTDKKAMYNLTGGHRFDKPEELFKNWRQFITEEINVDVNVDNLRKVITCGVKDNEILWMDQQIDTVTIKDGETVQVAYDSSCSTISPKGMEADTEITALMEIATAHFWGRDKSFKSLTTEPEGHRDGNVIIIGEVASDEVAQRMINMAISGAVFNVRGPRNRK